MPGTGSINLTSAQAFRDHVEKHSADLISKAFYGFTTNQYLTTHEGVKGKLVLTELIVGELARRWAKSFAPEDDTLDFKPKILEVTRAKVELSICPPDFESSYLGMYRKRGQDHRFIPFEGYIMNKVFEKLGQEFEDSVWKGVAAGTPAADDNLSELYDGFKKIIADLVTGGHTTVATTGGTITNANALDLIEDMWGQLNDAYKTMQVDAYCSYATGRKYWNNHITKYQGAKPERDAQGRIRLEYGEGWLVPLPGLNGSERVIMTPRGNLRFGLDGLSDSSLFNFEQNKRNVDFWMDFMIGVQVALSDDDILVVNDLV